MTVALLGRDVVDRCPTVRTVAREATGRAMEYVDRRLPCMARVLVSEKCPYRMFRLPQIATQKLSLSATRESANGTVSELTLRRHVGLGRPREELALQRRSQHESHCRQPICWLILAALWPVPARYGTLQCVVHGDKSDWFPPSDVS